MMPLGYIDGEVTVGHGRDCISHQGDQGKLTQSENSVIWAMTRIGDSKVNESFQKI